MKVRDIVDRLTRMNPDDEIVLRHLGDHPLAVMTKIRVYKSANRVIIDGYDYERKTHENR